MWSSLLELLLDPAGAVDAVREGRRERRTLRRVRATELPCALRVVDGTHPGLGRRWRRGTARVPPGVLLFRPGSSWRPRLTMPVTAAVLQPPGPVPRWAHRAVGAQPRRIVLRTARATVEWLVPEEQLDRALGVTRPRAPEERPPANTEVSAHDPGTDQARWRA